MIVTKENATRKWVNEFNSFPQDMISKLMQFDIDSWHEVTKPTVGVDVWSNEYQGTYEVLSIDEETETAMIDVDSEIKEVALNDISLESDTYLPMWGTLWQFGNSCDDYWLEELDGLQLMSDCGFRIYEHDEWGYFFGIDGCGYDFYSGHWLPLYEARGLKWHDEEE